MKKLLFIFVIIVPLLAFAQNKGKKLPVKQNEIAKTGQERIDSLINMLPKYLEDTNKVILYYNIAKELKGINDDTSIKFVNMGLTLAIKLGFKQGIGDAKILIGSDYETKLNYMKALEYFDDALTTYDKAGLKIKTATAYEKTASVYSLLGNHAASIAYYTKAQNIYDKKGLEIQSANISLSIGWVYYFEGDYSKSLEYNNSALTIFTAKKDSISIASAYLGIGVDYNYMDSFDKAANFETKALNIFSQAGNKDGSIKSMVNMADIYDRQKNYAKALYYDNITLKLAMEANDNSDIAILNGNIGSINLAIAKSGKKLRMHGDSTMKQSNNLGMAISYLNKAVDYGKKNGRPDLLILYLNDLSEAYTLSGNYKYGLAYHQEYSKMKDSVFSQNNERLIVKMQLQNDFNKKEAISNEELKFQRIIIYSAIIGVVILIGFLLFVYRGLRVQHKLNDKITELINEREKTIETRTAELRIANLKLVEMIQYNAHNIREPLTRIMGVLNMREYVSDAEYMEYYIPMMSKSVADLDDRVKQVISDLEKTIENRN